MKKKILSMSLATILFISGGVYMYFFHLDKNRERTELEENERVHEQTGAWEALQLEIRKTKDPKLGYVPKDRLLKAYAYTEALRKKQAAMRAIPGIDWQERGPNNVAGRTNALLIDANDPTGNTVWAASSTGGLWKTTNMKSDNTTWTSVNDFFKNLAVVTIAQDPIDPQIMYFGTGDLEVYGLGIWKSTNGGNNWKQLPSTNPTNDLDPVDFSSFEDIERIIVTPDQTVLAATRFSLMRSTNQGATWKKIALGTVTDVVQASNNAIYICVDGNILKSTDDGKTFTDLNIPKIGNQNMVIAAAPSKPNVLYAMAAKSGMGQKVGGMIRSDDGGNTWNFLPVPKIVDSNDDFTRDQAWYNLEIAVDPEDEKTVWIGGIDLLRSKDKGLTWEHVSHWYGGFQLPYVHADQHFILFNKKTPKTAYFANDGGVFVCTNTDAKKPAFTAKNQNYNITYFYSVALHPTSGKDYILAGSQDNGTQLLKGPKIGSGKEVTGGDGMFCHIDQEDGDIQIVSYYNSNYDISIDGGKTFKTLDEGDEGLFVNPTDWSNKTDRLYAGTTLGSYRVYMNPAANKNKKDIKIPRYKKAGVTAVTCSEKVSDRVWIAFYNDYLDDDNDSSTVLRVEKAADDNPTFKQIRVGIGYITCIAVDPNDEDHLLVTSASYGVTHVSETKDNGVTWKAVDGNLPDMPVRWAMFSPKNSDQALIATELGVWSTDNINGKNTEWEPSNSGLANVRTDMLQYRSSDNLMAAATYGRGVFTSTHFKDAASRASSAVIASVDKIQAYPNPFVESLTVQLPSDQVIERANLYDIKGTQQKISLKNVNKGVYQLQTAGLAVGMYYLKVRTKDGWQVLKVVKQ